MSGGTGGWMNWCGCMYGEFSGIAIFLKAFISLIVIYTMKYLFPYLPVDFTNIYSKKEK